MFEIIGTFFSSIISGGLTGILGVAVQRHFDLKKYAMDLELQKQKHDHELNMRKADAEMMAAEWAARSEIAVIEGRTAESVADANAFAASFNEPQRYSENVKPTPGQGWSLVLLDFIRGLVRPLLTVYLCIVTTLIYTHIKEVFAEKPLLEGEAAELMRLIVGTILYLTTTCLLWWFGVRNRQKPPKP